MSLTDESESKMDPRLVFRLKVSSAIKLMDSRKCGARITDLTRDTVNAFHRTLHAMVYIIKKHSDVGFDYVLSSKI